MVGLGWKKEVECEKQQAVRPDTTGFGLGWRKEAVCEKHKAVRPDSIGFPPYIIRDLTLIGLTSV